MALKVGDIFSVEGYQSITLTDDMASNIRAFASANNISTTQAQGILSNIPALRDFSRNFTSEDIEDIVLTDFSLEDIDNLDTTGYRDLLTKTAGSSSTRTGGTTGGDDDDDDDDDNDNNVTGGNNTDPFKNVKIENYHGIKFQVVANSSGTPSSSIKKNSNNNFTIEAKNCHIKILELPSVTNGIYITTTGEGATFSFECSTKQITNEAKNATINGSKFNDYIINRGQNATINAGAGNDTIDNTHGNATGATLKGGDGNDKITNYRDNAKIYGEKGEDTITNVYGKNVTIDGGSHKDTIENHGESATIDGGMGSDTITNHGKKATIKGSYGNDIIKNYHNEVTIDGGNDNDTIENHGQDVLITDSHGYNNVTNKGNKATITLKHDPLTQDSYGDNTVVNYGYEATITTGVGNDKITNYGGKAQIKSGDGNDTVINQGSEAQIETGEGKDTVTEKGHKSHINTGAGDDTITVEGNYSTVDGSTGSDKIINKSYHSNITSGDNDTIEHQSENHERHTILSHAFYTDTDPVDDDNDDDDDNDGTNDNGGTSSSNRNNNSTGGSSNLNSQEKTGSTAGGNNNGSSGNNLEKTGNSGAPEDTTTDDTPSNASGGTNETGNPNNNTGTNNINITSIDELVTTLNLEESPNWTHTKTITKFGITFKITSAEAIDDIQATIYNNLVTINLSDCKVEVVGIEDGLTRSLQIEGSGLHIYNNQALTTLFNYADNSVINGSSGNDKIFTYGDNVVVKGNAGNDNITTRGKNTYLYGGDGDDKIFTEIGADQTYVDSGAGKDKVYNFAGQLTEVTEITATENTKEYNTEVTKKLLTGVMNNTPVILAKRASDALNNSVNTIVNKLLTDKDGQLKREFNDTAKNIIAYIKSNQPDLQNADDIECIMAAIGEMDTDNNGIITEEEINAIITKTDVSTESINSYYNNSTVLKSLINAEQVTGIISSTGSNYAALNLLKKAEIIYNNAKSLIGNNTAKLQKVTDNIKLILTTSGATFNNEILEDAQILIDAEASGNKNQYIKDQMIKPCTDKTDEAILADTSIKVGDVISKADGLYVKENGKITKLNITAETYLELFPPITRYMTSQGDYGDCFFIATTMIDYMENDAGRAKLLQMIKEDNNGNITITIPGVEEFPVTFENGQLKTCDGIFDIGGEQYTYQTNSKGNLKVVPYVGTATGNIPVTTPVVQNNTTTALGLQLFEQAYAIAKFAQLTNTDIDADDIDFYGEGLWMTATDDAVTNTNSVDIDKALSFYLEGGFAQEVYADLKGSDTIGEYSQITSESQGKQLLARIATQLKDNPNAAVTTLILGKTNISAEDRAKYNITHGHQYAIERIDTIAQVVYFKNPWDAYKVTAMPYDVFLKYFYGFSSTSA